MLAALRSHRPRAARVLLVDDDPDTRVICRLALEHHGYEVLEADQGELALRLSRRRLPDLVLLDLSLPVMDGWEVARRLKGAPETADIPIVVFTAHAMAAEREKALAVGCDGYLVKPAGLREVVEEVRRVLGAG